ncbi:flagellar type III secretion system pore protein FliP [Roseovarius rhodophyticola]|uniref:Flagellar biosynthetic protein FliP n=1 Tax=Roseovarius rhodophyticola TaxID=3080827 RepID=A0ABZ2TIX4_9RHOB|nr:flagellar type III secretion system pore protein FliP [Roseovarius sp. W115]MDV2930005.1 flagellar type III secretion system pore protein FliP [Roseovarius sp. W115]
MTFSHRASLLALVFLVASYVTPAFGQELSVSLGEGESISARAIQILVLVTVLSLAPGLAIMITCFPFMVTVLAILRQGIGLQQSPPNMLLISLALFLTYFVMEPVFNEAWSAGIVPLLQEEISTEEGVRLALDPFRAFMSSRIDQDTYLAMASLRPEFQDVPDTSSAPLSLLIPSFMLSEISRAFQVGFLLFLPFLIIDLVVAAVLMSMGMMMVPPAIVSLPFKLAFFVIADGWTLVADGLVRGYF